MAERVAGLDRDLPGEQVAILRKLGELASADGRDAWLVGGLVRDLFLGVGSADLDVVVEGDAIAFARKIKDGLKADLVEHERFLTATLTLPGMVRVDVATARTEAYEKPGDLPRVEPAAIQEDMKRRDFTINAMAVCLAPTRWGELFDPLGGRIDLDRKLVRILHGRSFLDDPTRILRAVRFEQRFDFTIDEGTLILLREAMEAGVFGSISGDRLREEFLLVFLEPEKGRVLRRMQDLGILSGILAGDAGIHGMNADFSELMERADNLVSLVEKGNTWDPAVLDLLILMRGMPAGDVEKAAGRLNMPTAARKALGWAASLPEAARKASEEGGMGSLNEMLNNAPLEVQLAVLVMMEGEDARRMLVEYMRHGHAVRPELTGDDLKEMGYTAGPGLKRILAALAREKLDGNVEDRDDEVAFVKGNFRPPDGEAAA